MFAVDMKDNQLQVSHEDVLRNIGVRVENEHDATVAFMRTVGNNVFNFLEHAGL